MHPTLPATDTPPVGWQQPFWFAIAGFFIGLVAQNLGWLYTNAADQTTSWVGLGETLKVAIAVLLPIMLLLWSSGRGMIAPVFLAVMLAVAGWVGWQAQIGGGYSTPITFMSFAYYILLLIASGISLTFAQAWQRERPHFSYPRLFAHAWDNVHSVLLALAFALLTFILIIAATALFESILPNKNDWQQGIERSLTSRVMENYLLIELTALGAGIGVIQQHSGLLLRLHTLVFALYNLLAYLLAVIILGFALLLLPQWQAFLDDHEAAGILLALVAVSILFLNTLVERGSPTLPRWAQALFGAQLLVLPLLVALAVYALGLRVGQYGLSPQRMAGLLLGGLLLAYTLAYAVQFVRYRSTWTEGLKAVNPPLAMLAGLLALLMLTPVLDPQGWSARNQLARLQSGAVEAKRFDYHAVRHTFGKPGTDAIATMQGWKTHPQYADISKGITEAADPYQSPPPEAIKVTAATVAKIPVFPAGKTVDVAAFLNRMQDISTVGITAMQCQQPLDPNTECLLVLRDVNGDGKDEALLLGFVSVPEALAGGVGEYHIDATLYLLDTDNLPIRGKSLSNASVKLEAVENGGGYGIQQVYPPLDKITFEQVKASARAGQLAPVMPELPELQVGGQRLREQ